MWLIKRRTEMNLQESKIKKLEADNEQLREDKEYLLEENERLRAETEELRNLVIAFTKHANIVRKKFLL